MMSMTAYKTRLDIKTDKTVKIVRHLFIGVDGILFILVC